MEIRTTTAKVPLLEHRIEILNKNAVEASAAKQVFRTVGVIQALVRVSPFILRPP